MTNYRRIWCSDSLKEASSFDELIEFLDETSQEFRSMSEAGVTFEYVDEGRYCFCTEDPQVAKRFNLKPEHIWIQPTQSQRTKLQKLREEVVREMRKDVALMRKITLRRKS